MTDTPLEYFTCSDLSELETNAKNVLRIALKKVGALPVSQVPLASLVEIDELQRKIAGYQLEIQRRCSPAPVIFQPLGVQGAELFISYASTDSDAAEALAVGLTKAGISVFFAPASIRSADSYVDALNRGLSSCRSAVLLWSFAASESFWVKNEVNFLTIRRNRGDLLMEIVRLDPVEVPPLLQEVQRRDAFDRNVSEIAQKIVDDLHR